MSQEDKIKKWWAAVRTTNIIDKAIKGYTWDDLMQSDRITVRKAYEAACKIDELSVDRSGITFIGKIPEGHTAEFIVRPDRSAALVATPDDGLTEPKIYELGKGYNWQDIKKVASIGQPTLFKRIATKIRL